MKQLGELSLQEHTTLKNMGMLFEMYPDATGNVDDDLDAVVVDVYTSSDWSEFNPICKNMLPKVKVAFFYDIIDEEVEYDW